MRIVSVAAAAAAAPADNNKCGELRHRRRHL